MNKIFKYLRSIIFINWSIRTIVYRIHKLLHGFLLFFEKHWPVSGIINVKLPSGEKFKLYSKGDDDIPAQTFWKGYLGYEPSMEIFYELAKKSETIFDIGANIGYYSIVAAAANSNSKIYAFEPVPRIMERLKKQININKFEHIFPEMMVASNKKEKIPFYIPKGGAMALAASTKKGWVKETDEVLIDAITLDEYKQQKSLKKINLIKMDCEFHEWEVLDGMKQILKTDTPDILMEILLPEWEGVKGYFNDDSYIKIEALMKSLGYNIYLIYKGALIRIPNLEYNPVERNFLFSKKLSKQTFSTIPQFVNENY